ncbi:MAG: alpha-galactosidase [Chloroflexota bacterium]|nr:alpha-galactosidase [Chloroflexota bacterium]
MPTPALIDLSHEQLTLRLGVGTDSTGATLSLPEDQWGASSPRFAVYLGSQVLHPHSPDVKVESVDTTSLDGTRTTHIRYVYSADNLEIVQHIVVYDGTALFETWHTVRNQGLVPVQLTRLDSLVLDLPPAAYELLSYTSNWGAEWEAVRAPLGNGTLLETKRGRSSKDHHPWFALFHPDGPIMSASVAWSGNWVFRFEQNDDRGVRLSGGLHDWEWSSTLAPGATVASVPVVVALGADGDMNTVSTQYARVGRAHWYPRTPLGDQLPVEWNHWWSYEDHQIDEYVFRANVDVAARLGIEVCTLDAGWFGPSEPGAFWNDYRGDWAYVNTARFPSGLRALGDYVHERGMAFGLWCEIEALGQHARLADQHPEFVATRGGERLGYVCFGNPAVEAWALDTLSSLIESYGLDWIKLDFNLDPAAGCDRTDHGHAAGDGLYAHYQGYYRALEHLRARYPNVILENCSSGGLRIDLGILRRTVPTFLSDPDWPEHGLQLIWGASTMLAPNAWLHWGWSEWINQHPRQTFNPRDPQLQPHQLDYYVRIGMLGAFGLSQKLPELPPWVAERYAAHIALYKTTLRRFVREADFFRLTDQPGRDGGGDRWSAFQYVLPDAAEHLVAVFRLPGGEAHRTLRLYHIEAERIYDVVWLLTDRAEQWRGADLLAQGLRCDDLAEQGSMLLLLR